MWLRKIILSILCLAPSIAKAESIPLPNPLRAQSIPELSGQMIKGLLGVSGAIALFMMVWGGITWMTSNGSAERLKKGKDTILWTILGIVIIFLSYVIINFLFTVIGTDTEA
ncbi:MAG: pilin [Patescibacteria group bacterium]|jgi:type IV secretory pathway VirB2 component (pilin)